MDINDFFIQEENMTYLYRAMHELIEKLAKITYKIKKLFEECIINLVYIN